MIVEIYGARFVNKGAEMMLYAIVNKIKEQYPDAKFVLSCSSKAEFDLLTQKGFYKRITYRKHILDLGDLGRFIPKSVRLKNNIVLEKEIDVFFEASGFAYGDQWTYRMANYVANKFEKFKRNKTKLVVMPQALGPFNNQLNNQHTMRFINLADYVFVRDKQSFEYLEKLDIKHKNVKLMPDFTMLLKPQVDEKYIRLKDAVLIVPNKKVITTSKLPNIEELYTEMLKETILKLSSKGISTIFLIHEGVGDYHVAEAINNKLPNPIEIVWEKDIYKLKGIISQGKALIGSRFHSLVSSLSQAIPSIAIGWSHKYQMLFEDFNTEKNIFKVDDRKEVYLNKVDEFFTDNELLSEKENLLNQSAVQKEKIDEMWQIIFEKIIQ
ncbi:polysaccharide pyruvyl transferase family protein [Flavobacterium sp. CBA20B-1]|uniref:polysaccharide pyruvyl transferase family protein n=1 Tax=unclassified Flavobacterium TaxID=196869 RepID=UPI002225823C|nr:MULTISPECIES: polysaccharide pyruvyl transferase family protein [unclassified Flavobacterium]WCM42247.1 polysaccharide pyruvyl transferase family protein [Flavobacterium sp. CBA20B-1]